MNELLVRTSNGEGWRYGDAQISRASLEDLTQKRDLDRRLDQALEDTFPASDPVSIVIGVRK